MTTTLRPTGAERHFSDGSRSCAYEIRVNSRAVGELRLRTETEPGGTALAPAPVGRLEMLRVDPSERRRGRGTVAALASEEVLRGWGCTRLWVAVPGTAREALGLASALGYRETNCHMTKVLRSLPQLPNGSDAAAASEQETARITETHHESFVDGAVAHGLERGFAEAKSRATLAELLPVGGGTAPSVLRVLTHDGEAVGSLWIALDSSETEGAFVYGVQVDQAHRGRGHGRTLMLLAEREAITAGATTLGLNVFARNTPARTLYTSLGYETTLLHFNKPLL